MEIRQGKIMNLTIEQQQILPMLPARFPENHPVIQELISLGLIRKIPSPTPWGRPFFERTVKGDEIWTEIIKSL